MTCHGAFPALPLLLCVASVPLWNGTQLLTFWAAVRSSARAAAKFLAHWLSCIAEAWSVMVGTVALAAATIFPPGCQVKRERHEKGTNRQHLSAAHLQEVS